jgi:hypothetical protein
MAFDPNKKYEEVEGGGFDPSKPFTDSGELPSINNPTDVQPLPRQQDSLLTQRGAETASAIYRPILEYGGGMAAGVAAAPTGPIGLAAAGTLGYAGGSQLADILDRMIGVQAQPTSVGQIAEEAVGDLREGAMQELVGASVAVPIGFVAGKTMNALSSGARAAIAKAPEVYQRVSDAAKRIGIDLSPAELMVTRGTAILESVLDNTVFTAGIMKDFKLDQIKKLNDTRDTLLAKRGSTEEIEALGYKIKSATDDYFRRFGVENKAAQTAMKNRLQQKLGARTSYEDLDISGKQAVAQYEKGESEKISKAYTAVREMADEAMPEGIVPKNIVNTAKEILKEQESLNNPALVDREIVSIAKGFIGDVPKIDPTVASAYANATPDVKRAIEAQYPEILLGDGSGPRTYTQLNNMVKALNVKKFNQVDTNGKITNVGRQLDVFIDALHKDMGELAKSTGNKQIIEAHDAADSLFKNRLALFDDPAFKKITSKNPSTIVNTIYRSGEPDLIRRYQALVGKDVSEMAKKKLTGEVLGFDLEADMTGKHIRTQLEKLGEGKDLLYTPKELEYFEDIANAIDLRSTDVNKIMVNPMFKRMLSESQTAASAVAEAVVQKQNTGIPTIIENRFGPAVKKKVADGFLPVLLGKDQAGDFNPTTFVTEFDRYGKPTLEAWYGKDTADILEDLATIGRAKKAVIEAGANKSGTAKNMIFYHQGEKIAKAIGKVAEYGAIAAVTGTGYGNFVLGLGALGGEGAIILGSRKLAMIYNSPFGRKLFIDGLMTKAGTEEAGRMTGKILSIIGNEFMRSKEKKQ